jgi:hypothetical protein
LASADRDALMALAKKTEKTQKLLTAGLAIAQFFKQKSS